MAKKIVVVGLDAATWRLLDSVLAAGIMPRLQDIINQGAKGVLRSTMPPYTAPAWTTFATGVHPGKHGCYDFLLPTGTLEDFTLCNSDHIRTTTIYELFHSQGLRSILINLPNSYPPKLPTPTITDMLTVGNNCVFPEDLKNRYPLLQHYRLAPNEALNVKGRTAAYIDDMIAVERDHMTAVKQLWENEPWDFFFYLFSSTDWISHAMFDRLLGLDSKAMELFRFIDEQLGWFKEHLPPDTSLYIVSDHGFKVYHQTFYFNKWLEQEGYLATKQAPADAFHQGISKQDEQRTQLQQHKRWQMRISPQLMRRLSRVKAVECLARWFYHRVAKPFLPVRFSLDVVIDFTNTAVCFPKGRTMTAIYINDGRKYRSGKPMTDVAYRRLRQEVIDKLKRLRGPDGQVVTPRVYTKEEIYGNDVPERCPDIFYEFGDYWFVGQFHSSELFVQELSNKHDPYGIVVACGPDIQRGQVIPEQSMADLAPTLLYDLGQVIPRYMDGKVMPIFTKDRQPQYVDRPLLKEKYWLKETLDDITI